MSGNTAPEASSTPIARDRFLQWTIILVLVLSLGSCVVFLVKMYEYDSPDYYEVALRGEPIVEAVLAYREENGEYPAALDEADLSQVEGVVIGNWEFDAESTMLIYTFPEGRDSAGARVGYFFEGNRPGWFVLDETRNRPINMNRPDKVID